MFRSRFIFFIRVLDVETQNRQISEELEEIKNALNAAESKALENESLKENLEQATAEIEKLKVGVDSIAEINKIKVKLCRIIN